MSDEKNCKITLYLTTPTPMMSKKDNLFERSGMAGFFGHASVSITDESGKESRWGFVPQDFSRQTLKTMIKGCGGSFYMHNKYTSPYNEAVVYPVTREQYDAAQKKIDEIKENKDQKYTLFSNNCATVANSILKAGGVAARCPAVVGLSPHTLTLNKRAMLAKRRIAVALFKAKNKIAEIFGAKKAPDSKIMDKLRSKPMPVALKVGTRFADIGEPLDTNTVIANLMNRKKTR